MEKDADMGYEIWDGRYEMQDTISASVLPLYNVERGVST